MKTEAETLILYMRPSCPFCIIVMRTIKELHIDVELRDIGSESRYYEELVGARKRATVPVLRIISECEERWMPESADIIDYLQKI